MQFVLYTNKTVKQCLTALNERMQVKGSKSRPEITGWIDQDGEFLIAMTSQVARFFVRKTPLQARLERESGVTVISGSVMHGANPRGQMLSFAALLLVGVLLMFQGNAMLAILAILMGAALYIPLAGDHKNSALLVKELRRIFQASDKPPKK